MRMAKGWAAGAAAVMLLTLGASACGGGSPNAAVAHLGPQTSTTVAGSPSAGGTGGGADAKYADALAFAQCMRSHGVPRFPAPTQGGGFLVQGGPGSGLDPNSPKFQAAQHTCSKLLPNGGQPSPAQQQADLARALRFSQCMRAHGITDFPDPALVAGGGIRISIRAGRGGHTDLDPHSPQFQAAQTACGGIMGGKIGLPGGKGPVGAG